MSAIASRDRGATRQRDTRSLGITEIHRLTATLPLSRQGRSFGRRGRIKIQDAIFEIFFQQLRKGGFRVATQVEVPAMFDGIKLDVAFRADIIVEALVILELKSVEALAPVHSKQLLNYLKLSGLKVGLLLNFNTVSLKDQIIRLVN